MDRKKIDIPISFSVHGNGDTMRIGWMIQCLPYSRFFYTPMILGCKCLPQKCGIFENTKLA